jgi:hypothetical protein
MLIVRATLFVCGVVLESVTANVSGVRVAVAVGAPEITPLDALRASPPGRVPAASLHARGSVPPVAASALL